jgi:hypothetical protein
MHLLHSYICSQSCIKKDGGRVKDTYIQHKSQGELTFYSAYKDSLGVKLTSVDSVHKWIQSTLASQSVNSH